jgi:membrane associated rhomboid family serine protease
MPPCVDCGQETERSEMYGPPDELRCRACVQKLQERLEPEPSRPMQASGTPVTFAVMGVAVVTTLGYWLKVEWVHDYLLMSPPAIWDGQLWRLLTACFLHADPLHLAFNLYWLWILGSLLEQWLGSLRYVALLLLFAFGSSAAQFTFDGPAVGLSGVGFALFGLFYALRLQKDFAAAVMSPQTVQIWVIWFFACIVLTYAKIMPVGNTAHGVGALIGWAVGRALLARRTALWLSALTGAVLLLTGAAFYQPWSGDYAWHRGYTLAQRGEYEAALVWYRQAERSYPDNKGVKESIRALEWRIQERNWLRDPQEK